MSRTKARRGFWENEYHILTLSRRVREKIMYYRRKDRRFEVIQYFGIKDPQNMNYFLNLSASLSKFMDVSTLCLKFSVFSRSIFFYCVSGNEKIKTFIYRKHPWSSRKGWWPKLHKMAFQKVARTLLKNNK